jgi:low molecular weight protein-tyrosine phosphatase
MKILFVCTGNICRSPTAHAVFRHMAYSRGKKIVVDSAGTHAYHVGHAPDQRSAMAAKKHGYDMADLKARQVSADDFQNFDLILCMDAGHKMSLERIAPPGTLEKIQMFDSKDVGDPYHGGLQGFEDVLEQIETACERWLAKI